MKFDFRLALLSSALASVTVSAFAADLPARKAAVPPPVLATSMWDGFYTGINGGYGWTGSNSMAVAAFPGPGIFTASGTAAALASQAMSLGSVGGLFAGGQTGYNKQFGSILLGWESDIVFFGARGKSAGAISFAFDPLLQLTLAQAAQVSAQINWLTTSRLRVGFLPASNLLLYATAGVAAGGVRATTAMVQNYFNVEPGGGFGSYSSSRIGYAIGGGAEWMFAPKWSLRAEYLYYDLGRASFSVSPVSTRLLGLNFLFPQSQAIPFSSYRFNGQLFRLGLNYFWDWRGMLPAPASAPSPDFVAWNGFYIGANFGYGWSGSNGVNVASAPGGAHTVALVPIGVASVLSASLPRASSNGFLGGAQIGTQAQFGSFVAGWEMDLQWMGAGSGRSSMSNFGYVPVGPGFPIVSTISGTNRIDWLSTSRARLGYLVTPSVLAYGTAGFAMGGVKSTTATSFSWPTGLGTPGYGYGAYSQARLGYSLGAGAEWAISPNWSLRAEYLYYDLGRAHYAATPASSMFDPTSTQPTGQAFTSASTRFNGSLVRAGLNYHWNWDQPAVVAKY